MSRPVLREMLASLRRWLGGLEPRGLDTTTWADYDATVPKTESRAIAAFVESVVRSSPVRMMWDLDCNAGRYSDPGALDRAFARAAGPTCCWRCGRAPHRDRAPSARTLRGPAGGAHGWYAAAVEARPHIAASGTGEVATGE